MNYVLNLQLEGAEQINSALDGLLNKVASIGNVGGALPPSDYLGAGLKEAKEFDKATGKAGESMSKSFAESFSKIKLDLAESLTELGDNIKLESLTEAAEKVRDLVAETTELSEVTKNNALRTAAGYERSAAQAKKRLDDEKAQPVSGRQYALAALATLYNPFVGARAFSDLQKQSGKSGNLASAIFGKGGPESYTENFAVIKTLQNAFGKLVSVIEKTIQSYDDARKLYAKSLMSGLGVGFTAKRANLAEILGVDETEVLRFGAALTYLGAKLEFANEVAAKTNKELTGVGWEFKILEKNIGALWMQIASGLSPAMMAFTENLNALLVSIGKSDFVKALASAVDVALIGLNDIVGVIELVVSAFVTGLKVIGDGLAYIIAKALNLLSRVPGLGGIGGFDTDKIKQDMADSLNANVDLLKKVAGNWLGGDSSKGVPTAQSYMKQLPASSWEKMGLVIGGGTNNYAQQTAKNTKDIADMMRASRRGNSGASQPFGMNLMTSNA